MAQPPARTDISRRAAPMPSDAMPLDEAPARASAMTRQAPGAALSQEQWNRRPVAQRGETPKLEKEWRATGNPNREVVPGGMRSDREEIPAGFTKADADKAETMEAALAGGDGEMRALAAPGCQVYWPAPYEVCGAIRDKYNALGGPNSFLLFPKTNELSNPDGIGKRTEFQNGPIYWSPQGGAHPVVNHFLAAWARHGYENSYIGYPTTDEIVNPDGIGRRQHFTGSTIYWRLNEAYSIGGAIADRWHQLGAEQGVLGYPTSDELVLPDGIGRMNRFQNGVIYWHPTTGAHEIRGTILLEWAADGYEQGAAGYPVAAPELRNPYDTYWSSQQFQHQMIFGALETSTPIVREYDDLGSVDLYTMVQRCLADDPDDVVSADGFVIDSFRVKDSDIRAALDCETTRHIVQDHFKLHPLNPEELHHFIICAQHTLQADPYTGETNPVNWGMQRDNTFGEATGVVVMERATQRVVTSWSKRWGSPNNEKSREFTRCAYGLAMMY